jgi:putative transposase
LLAEASAKAGTEVWGYCLMPNHVHLILTPGDPDGLRRTLGDLHRRYTAYVNARRQWTGHLWQGRFGSVAMDETHLYAALRYVSLNPVRARLVERAEDWPWSSVRAHLAGKDNGVVRVAPALERVGRFANFLAQDFDAERDFAPLRRSETSGRPVGDETWIRGLERELGRGLLPSRRGRKPRERGVAETVDLFK